MDDGRAALTAGERFFAFAVGVGVALFAWLSGNSDIFPPELWDEISVAAGVRPPPAALPAFWRRAVSLAIGSFGIERTLLALRLLGPAALGALATMSFFFLAGLLPDTLRLEMRRWRWGRRLVLSVLVQGALCFAMSEPVWYVCRALTPDAANLLVAVFFVCAFRRALAHGGTWPLIAMSALAGFAAADTILAFAVPAAVAVAVALMLNQGSDSLGAQLQNPLLRFVALRRSAAVYTFALAGGVWANVVFFGEGGGPQAHSWSPVMCLLQYLYAYVLDLKAQARPIGWILMFLVCVAPLVVSARYAARATDGAAVLPYPLALFYAVTGVFLFTQSAGVPAFWFWHWVSSSAPLMSGTLLGLCLLMTSAAVTLSLCVGSVGLYCRNTAGILQLKFEDVAATTTGWRKALAATRFAGRLARAALVAEPALAVLILCASRFSPVERDMAAVVDEYVRATADECGDAHLLFTDGSMDAAVEVQALRQGRSLKAVSMASGDSAYDRSVRCRGETDKEDSDMLATSASGALRTWVGEKTERSTNIAVQVGFELWKHNGLEAPEAAGFVARTAGFDPGEKARFVARARALAGRILAVCENDDPDDSPNVRLKNMFASVEWRLSRLCRMRADDSDRNGRAADAMRDTGLADGLDEANAAYRRMRSQMNWTELRPDTRLTPREGMALWMGRGDFQMARLYAKQILIAHPQDSRANFAVGMSYFVEEQYNRAEAYLARSLLEHPDEPAALNNLAVVQAKLGRLDEAETNALRALKSLPGSKEATRTLNAIREKRKESPEK